MSSIDDKNPKPSTAKKAKPYPSGGPKLRKRNFIHDPALEQAMRLTYRLMKKYGIYKTEDDAEKPAK